MPHDRRAFRGKAAIDGAWSPAPPKAAAKESFWSRAIAIVLGFSFSVLAVVFAIVKNF